MATLTANLNGALTITCIRATDLHDNKASAHAHGSFSDARAVRRIERVQRRNAHPGVCPADRSLLTVILRSARAPRAGGGQAGPLREDLAGPEHAQHAAHAPAQGRRPQPDLGPGCRTLCAGGQGEFPQPASQPARSLARSLGYTSPTHAARRRRARSRFRCGRRVWSSTRSSRRCVYLPTRARAGACGHARRAQVTLNLKDLLAPKDSTWCVLRTPPPPSQRPAS
jgi:hypothetical protein